MLPQKLARHIAPCLIIMMPAALAANEISLATPEGTTIVAGQLMSVEGDQMTVQTADGPVRVQAAGLICHGYGCPTLLSPANTSTGPEVVAADTQSFAVIHEFINADTASSSRRVRTSVNLGASTPPLASAQVRFSPAASPADGTVVVKSVTTAMADDTQGTLFDWITNPNPPQLLAAKTYSVVTAADTGVDRLTLPQLAGIFAGEIVNWAEVGGANLDMALMLTDETTRLFEEIETILMRPARKPITPVFESFDSAGQIAKAIRTTAGGIGILPSDVAPNDQAIGITNSCGLTTWPTAFAIQSGDYPLTLSTVAVHPTTNDESTLHATFDQAAIGHDLPENGLLHLPEPQKAERFVDIMFPDAGQTRPDAATDLIARLIDADQLSLSFRDGPLTEIEGAWARRHFVKLRAAINAGSLDGQEILFVGFAPDTGPTASDAWSLDAATSVMDAFRTFAPDAAERISLRMSANGHGALGHPGCTTSGATYDQTARVEVWIHPTPFTDIDY